jgi:hypothetical protein
MAQSTRLFAFAHALRSIERVPLPQRLGAGLVLHARDLVDAPVLSESQGNASAAPDFHERLLAGVGFCAVPAHGRAVRARTHAAQADHRSAVFMALVFTVGAQVQAVLRQAQ